jgi:hypothetical protein
LFNFNCYISTFLLLFITLLLYYFITLKEYYEEQNLLNNLGIPWSDYTLPSFFIIFPVILTFFFIKFLKWKSIIISFFVSFLIQWYLFLNVNPCPLVLDNKLSIMNLIPEKYRPSFQMSLLDLNNVNFNYPIVIKPVKCSGNGIDVFIIKNNLDFENFLKNKMYNIDEYMVQSFLTEEKLDFCILYEKLPWEKKGKIIEIIEKTQISLNNIRNCFSYNNELHDDIINNKTLNDTINFLSDKIPDMNCARYDILATSKTDLINNNFKIVEINGTMGMNLKNVANAGFIGLILEIRWYLIRIIIGFLNIILLKGYSILNLPMALYKSFMNFYNCYDWENIYSLYS